MTQTSLAKTNSDTFVHLRKTALPALNLTLEEYEHTRTGAKHWHFDSDNQENVFLVAFRTLPMDNTGVAHILEHTVLCGSERFPVRDPFFMMLRRSLNTFMNAFTASDWTAYPFASKNKKDFNNLLDVYLDATFFPLVNLLDFAQEGHRIEFERAKDKTSPLVYKGVVFNEMKGAMSSVHSRLYQSICKYLFPTNTYHYNSGGEPESIVDLSYGELKQFYSQHYHPSNAVFMTFGDIPAAEHQAMFEEKALHRFSNTGESPLSVPPEKRLFTPIGVTEAYGVSKAEELSQATHHTHTWLLGPSTHLMDRMEAELLSSALLNNSASPLRQALETSELGLAPSALCGLEDDKFEMSFYCGLEGSEPEHAAAVKALVFEVLERLVKDGVPHTELESILDQLEFSQREITGDGFPYGLQVVMSAISPAIHNSDVASLLNLEPVLKKLRQNIQYPDYIKQLAKVLLLDNPHRVDLSLAPDLHHNERKAQAEKSTLEQLKLQLSDKQADAIIQQTTALEEHQQLHNDASILPKVGVEDVPESNSTITASHKKNLAPYALTHYNQGTNGISYQQIITPLPKLSEEQLVLLPHYVEMITELGVGKQSYLQQQKLQAQCMGGFNTFCTTRSQVDNINKVQGYLVLSGKSLNAKTTAMTDLLHNTYHHLQFSELDRLQELLAQSLTHHEQTITDNGHGYAQSSASAGLSKLGALRFKLQGLASIESLRTLTHGLSDKARLNALSEQLTNLHKTIIATPCEILSISEESHWQSLEAGISKQWQSNTELNTGNSFDSGLTEMKTEDKQAWSLNTQVNFCAKAFPTVAEGHEDAPKLQVLAGYLRNCYLHAAIREKGGAYGGGASHDALTGSFRFYSYRDPRLSETLSDFDLSVQQFLSDGAKSDKLEESIIGVISDIDAPSSPAGEAKSSFVNDMFGRTQELRSTYRKRVLNTSCQDLEAVAEQYLQSKPSKTVVLTTAEGAKTLSDFHVTEF